MIEETITRAVDKNKNRVPASDFFVMFVACGMAGVFYFSNNVLLRTSIVPFVVLALSSICSKVTKNTRVRVMALAIVVIFVGFGLSNIGYRALLCSRAQDAFEKASRGFAVFPYNFKRGPSWFRQGKYYTYYSAEGCAYSVVAESTENGLLRCDVID